MPQGAPRRVIWGVALAALFAGIIVLSWQQVQSRRVPQRAYRIGWQPSPPYQESVNGAPSGLVIELLREAARRRHISLEWVPWSGSSEAALRSGQVDLWALITITAERRKTLHLTEPYISTEHAFIVRAASPFRRSQDLANARISFSDTTFARNLLHDNLPNSLAVGRPGAVLAFEDVCEMRADAAFIEVSNGIAALLEKQNCPGAPLRWIGLPALPSHLAIGSTQATADVADMLREEIGTMARDGSLALIVGNWGFNPARDLDSMQDLLDARRNAARLMALSVLLGLLLAATSWQAVRIMRQRNRAKQAEQAIRELEQKLRLMANNLKEMVLAYDMNRKLIYSNPAVETLTGYSLTDFQNSGFIDWIHPDDRQRMLLRWDTLFSGAGFQNEEYRLLAKDGQLKWMSATWGPLLDESGCQVGIQGCVRDISDNKALQERYLQAQKLESIGRLAGGVAHDFNNLLTVINGFSDLMYRQLDDQNPLRPNLDQIRKAGSRAAELTQQLLAFSRKQITRPRSLDLNLVVEESEKMLRRVVGEDIELVTILCEELRPVMADPGHMEQILMNLVVNARDAMPGGGRITIETSNVDLDAGYAAERPGISPGRYALLTISDTGTGMDEETKKRLFEPFFTTKELGRGTGLGLATVYGIVKQNQGWIWVYSELGRGTTFKIYLPAVMTERPVEKVTASTASPVGGRETILIVEDQDDVRGFTRAALEAHNFCVLEAANAVEALELVGRYSGPIHLMITDVVLPGANGRELATEMKRHRPEMRVLFTSGYPQEVIAHRGILDRDVAYIPKPYSPDAIAARAREVLA